MKIKVLKTIILKPLTAYSTNRMYQSLQTTTNTFPPKLSKVSYYRKWRNKMQDLLPPVFLPRDMTGFGLGIEVGVRKEFDLDNTLKSLIDALQEKYKFNDRQIQYLYAKKIITGEGELFDPSNDFIKISLLEANVELEYPQNPEDYLESDFPDLKEEMMDYTRGYY